MNLLEYAQKTLKIRPKYVAFDSWYASREILTRLREYRWTYDSQLKKNRIFQGVQLQTIRKGLYWKEAGNIFGGMRVLVVKHGKKYFVTNELSASSEELRAMYKTRWKIETMFRILYTQLGFEQCESRSLQAQTAHMHLCLFAFLLLEKARAEQHTTHYALRRNYRFHPEQTDQLLMKLNFGSA